jgi:glycosyltransferase involved in cell wall biosynthesis
MIRNLPVIITPGCNIPEVEIYDAGLIVEPNENGITKALQWITGPLEILNKAGNNAFALATTKFSIEQSLLQYNRLIEDSK